MTNKSYPEASLRDSLFHSSEIALAVELVLARVQEEDSVFRISAKDV
jgi:hypothetical protein